MIRINDLQLKATVKAAAVLSALLLFAAAATFGQQVVNLTAGAATTTLPDGTTLPMWGYSCGLAATGSTATCAPLSGVSSGAATGALGGLYVLSGGSGYSSSTSVTITPAAGNTPTTAAAATPILSGGVVVGFNVTNHGAGYTAAPTVTITDTAGTGATAAAAPAWSPVVITVPFVTGGASLTVNLTNNLSFTPVGGGSANNIPTSILIVGQVGGGLGSSRTATPSPDHSNAQGCATWFIASGATPPGVPCTAQQAGSSNIPPTQGPRVQSMATEVTAVAPGTVSSTSLTWANLRPGTYLLESGTHPSIQVPMGLIGMLVVTNAPSGTTAGIAYPAVAAGKTAAIPAVQYNAELPLEFSEIDPVQNKAVDLAVRTAGFSETAVWSAMTPVGGGAITALSVTNGGAGYSYPVTVSITSTNTAPPGGGVGGATASATLAFGVASVTGGSGYVVGDTLTFTGGGGSGAAATVATVGTGGSIATITLTSPGSGYTSAPTVVDSTTAAATGAVATLATTGSVSAINLSEAGVGYTAGTTTVTITSTPAATTPASVTVSYGAGGCGTSHTCYPPAVNYTPFYYLINGVSFSKGTSSASLFAATAGVMGTPPGPITTVTTGITGNVLVRLVNAGLRMHVPSIVGSQTTGFSGAGASATVGGFTLIAEDGNPLPNLLAPRVQTDVFMAAGKTYDVMINVPAATTVGGTPPSLPIFARDLGLSANSSVRDAGMLAYISINGAVLPSGPGSGVFAVGAQANPDIYNSVIPCASTASSCIPLVISDPSKGVIGNDINVYGVELSTPPSSGTLTCSAVPGSPVAGICANGTFTYTPNAGATTDSFVYCANGAPAGTTGLCTTVTLGPSGIYAGGPTAIAQTYTAKMATYIKISSPGLLVGNTDTNNLPLSLVTSPAPTITGGTVVVDSKGGFIVSLPTNAATTSVSFQYTVQNSQGKTATGTVTVNFPAPSNLQVHVLDAQAYKNCNANATAVAAATCIAALVPFSDYRWIIEEDKTFWVDPNCTTNSSITTPGCPTPVAAGGTIPTFGTNFHTSFMDFVAQGCTGPLSCEGGQTMLDTNPSSTTFGTHIAAVCDLGNGACRPDTTGNGYTPVNPSEVVLDPAKRYYISVLPGDAANPFPSNTSPASCNGVENTTVGNNLCGHTMSGAPIPPVCNILGGTNACTTATAYPTTPINVLVLPTPLPTGRLSVIVFEDDFPLNGEQDGGGGNGTVAPIEPGLGGFNLVLWDTFGGLGDVTGQDTYDAFNQPLSNGLAGTIDPVTQLDACPVSATPLSAPAGSGTPAGSAAAPVSGITGMIVTCPKYESDGHTLSPLAGQAVIYNLMPDKFSVQAYPGADRIARGEEWLQTNTLDGQHPHDSFIRIGEPGYFQEYGPAGYHVAIGFANPAIINARHNDVCNGFGTPGTVGPCTNTIDGQVDVQRISRTPDQRLYPSGSRDALTWTQGWVSLGDPDGEDFMFTKCDANGNFRFTNVPGGQWRLTIGDQWNDQIIDGLSTPANVGCTTTAPNTVIDTTAGTVTDNTHAGTAQVTAASENGSTVTITSTLVPSLNDTVVIAGVNPTGYNGTFTVTSVGTGALAGTFTYTDTRATGLSSATTCSGGQTLHMGNIGVQQWQSNLYTRVFIDDNKNGIWDPGEIGIPLIYTRVYYRDGSNANGLNTDFNGIANFNETYPLFNWYVVEADSTRYKTTGTHVVYDAGGPADGSPSCGNGTTARKCGTSTAYNFLTNTHEDVPLPKDLSVPGAVYCAAADCGAEASSFAAGTSIPSSSTASTGRIDPPWVTTEGWAGLTGLSNYIDFGKAPYASCPPACVNVPIAVNNPTGGGTTSSTTQVGENGGIHGQVTYAATRPFDNADQMILQPWEPLVPGVTINLYQEGFAADGVTPTLKMVDTTITSSWDYWAQGFWPNSTATAGTGQTSAQKPYMSCPGQGTATGTNADLFFFTLFDQPNFLDYYNNLYNGGTLHTLPYNAQYKCYDSMHMGNQIQPAPYNGEYYFPSSLGVDATTGKPVTTTGSTNGVASNLPGTNCTICVKNPDSTDVYRVGTPMLPPGKYVVEVIMPPGYEVYKEEDKNLLIGDNFIAPVTQQFGGLGTDIFIMPDQASVASMYDESASGYNSTNYQDETTGLATADRLSGVPGYPGFQDPVWPCVGEMRVVPDYLSLFPHAQEVAPFAGATRPLCDRKEVTLANQMSVRMHFAIFTSTHIASKFAGGITDDFTSEFDPFSPQFGEKFAPPNMPVSTRDYLGNELSRVYSDHWGTYDGLTFSSWEVNPPNITGYSPSMMVQCMNDPGPIPDGKGGLTTDPLYNSAYSNFCYEIPFMPGLTTYNDTPVVPTEAFVGAGYNNTDCSYPDATPAIKEVDGDAIGPYVSAAGATLTITALGDQQVSNNAYSGPSASVAPFNAKTITRHYGFGGQCSSPTATSSTCNTLSSVTIGGVKAIITGWSDTAISATVPGPTTTCTTASSTCNPTPVPACAIQQQAQYGGSAAQCGQLVITAGNGKQSIDTVTVTVGGKAPTHVLANQTIQGKIDGAMPGDLIMVDPGSHNELLIMWKPVRLQGVGAASSILNASAFPAGTLLDPWRRHINCLFGLTLSGVPYTSGTNPKQSATNTAPYDPTGNYTCPDNGWQSFNAQPNAPQIDRLPLEAVLGWDATLNGNLAEQLQEPSLMGAFEGAGITVLGKGVDYHGVNPWTDNNEGGAFPTNTTLLSGVGPNPTALPTGDANPFCHTSATDKTNPFPSDFTCNPSSIDGLSINNSSQGGGGIFAHGWAHHLQIANNRVYNNAGTLTGGISVGQGEFPTPYVQGGAANAAPGSCSTGAGFVTNQHLPYCLQLQVNVHNNYVSNNSSLGDELFSGTLAGAGGVTFCTGNDYYNFNYNWVCGNLSSGEGGGVVHLGEIQNGDIEHNSIVLNQSDNPTIPTNGGGIMVQGTPDTDPVCGTQIDADCPPGLSDGIGHNLTINANLIQGNMAESGSGGGIRLQQVNGSEVSTFPKQPNLWNNVSITNNIIVNNVAGWDGAGISLQDALNVSIINNTIASNDSLASSGVLTQSIGTPDASAPAGSCLQAGLTTSCPQSAGVTSTLNSTLLTTTFTGLTITCPAGQPNCTGFSNPLLVGNVIWQNRSFNIGISGAGTGGLNQQNLVSLFNANFTGAAGTPAPTQTASGQCGTGASYWDIGVRGDSGPSDHSSGFTLGPAYSVLDDPADYPSRGNSGSNPSVVSQYCNGSRVPPECTTADGCGGPHGYGVPPGIVDASTPNPVFSLTPSATVDEGNNWINVSWGPLALSNDAVTGGANVNYGGGAAFGNYAITATSPAEDYIPCSNTGASHCSTVAIGTAVPSVTLPTTDFFGNPRPDGVGNPNNRSCATAGMNPGPGHPCVDVGAVEVQVQADAGTLQVTPTSLSFPNTGVGTTSAAQTLTLSNSGTAAATGISETVTAPFSRPGGAAGGTCAGTLAAGATCTINIVFAPTSATAFTGTATINASVAVTGSPVTLSGTGVVLPTITSFSPSSGARGTTFTVTVTGTNFTSPATMFHPGSNGPVITNVVVVNATTATATFAVPANSALGNHCVTITTPVGTSVCTAASQFVVTAGPLAFTGPAPALTTTTANTTTKTGFVTVTNSTIASGPFAFGGAPTVTKVGGAGGTFSIIAGGTCTATTVLATGGSCTINVQYAPGTSTATATANVSVTGTVATFTETQTSANFTAN